MTTPKSLFLAAWAVAFTQPAASIEFRDPRPLAAAITHLQQTYGIALNYEDPPFQYEGDSVDITDQVQTEKQRQANPAARIRVPRGGVLSIPDSSISIRQGVAGDAMTVLSRLLVLHDAAGLPGRFVLEQRNGIPALTPKAVKNARGEWTAITSILDQPVSFPARDRSAAETVELLLSEITKRKGVKVALAAAPVQLFAQARLTLGSNDQTAASVLADIFQQLSHQMSPAAPGRTLLSYKLLYDPQLRYFLLTISPVKTPAAPFSANK